MEIVTIKILEKKRKIKKDDRTRVREKEMERECEVVCRVVQFRGFLNFSKEKEPLLVELATNGKSHFIEIV